MNGEVSLWCRKCNIAMQVTAGEFFNTGFWLFYSHLFLRSIGNMIVRHSKQFVIISDIILPGHVVMVGNLCCVYVWPLCSLLELTYGRSDIDCENQNPAADKILNSGILVNFRIHLTYWNIPYCNMNISCSIITGSVVIHCLLYWPQQAMWWQSFWQLTTLFLEWASQPHSPL